MPKTNNQNADNLLDLIPVPSVDWGESPDGTIYFIKQKFKSEFLTKCLKHFRISPVHKVHLDEFGSFVWKQCNGKKPVHEIGLLLQEHFGHDIEPVFERLGTFIRILALHQYIQYKNKTIQ